VLAWLEEGANEDLLSMGKALAIGLDIGLATTKMVVLEQRGNRAKVRFAATLDQRDEGILSSVELQEALTKWLGQCKYRDAETVIGMPQSMTNLRLTDFPPASGQQLGEMVEYDVQQFAGLSDESFRHDFHQQKAFADFKNPVLVGICAGPLVERQLSAIEDVPFNIGDIGMDGIALANAFISLHPKEAKKSDQLLLLDVGANGTTMVILENGLIAYAGSFPYGGDMITEGIGQAQGLPDAEAERLKKESTLVGQGHDTALGKCAYDFVSELNTALENWRFERGEGRAGLGSAPQEETNFEQIYISGGGAQMEGFREFLSSVYHAPVESFGLQLRRREPVSPNYSIAYGHALHGLRKVSGPARISLAPPRVIWAAQRRRRHVLLATAVLLTAVLLVGTIAFYAISLHKEQGRLDAVRSRLDSCASVIPTLQQQRADITQAEAMLAPFAARSNRNRIFIDAVELLSSYQQDEDWLAYLADETSYYDMREEEAPAPRPKSRPLSFRPGQPVKEVAALAPLLSTSFKPWDTLYCSGFIPRRDINPLGNIRQLLDELNSAENTIFEDADSLTTERSDVDVKATAPWLQRYMMRPFALRLPLKDIEFFPLIPEEG
jgi:type IV pilus assembly protein PilM